MRLAGSFLLLTMLCSAEHVSAPAMAKMPYFSVLSEDAGAWPAILSSIGLQQRPAGLARIFVARSGAAASKEWAARAGDGAILIVEGESSLAESFGFRASREYVKVNSVTDVHRPGLAIIWEHGLELPKFSLPAGAVVFAKERWGGAPMLAGLRRGAGAVLWVAVPPGERGYERFPYLLQALSDLGMDTPFRSSRLWAFFDSAYRARVDLDYFAARWQHAGISALQVAAWHFYEHDADGDEYLRKLIDACHRQGITVYAWLELPHVSEKFWAEHPQWREKTATLQDAQLDWRKLMNLQNRECFRAVSVGVKDLIGRFDWDGVNLAELYFESLEGMANSARFTPMNDDVRARFRESRGFDPLELFGPRRDQASRRAFLDFRSELAGEMQREWLAELESVRVTRPDLDLVLTHVDDRFDAGMRDAIGADAARVLPMLDRHSFTFMIEDPATVWHLGPERYQGIAGKYRPLTAHTDKLAIDLNIVDRYQNVYPTKQQTGTELFELVHSASASFARVALYFENSLLSPDLELLSSAAVAVSRIERVGSKTILDSAEGVGLPWSGAPSVDGLAWPVSDGNIVWLPAGAHSVESLDGSGENAHVVRFNGELTGARYLSSQSVEVSYRSGSHAIAVMDRNVRRVEIDGVQSRPVCAGLKSILLPRGQHVVTITTE